mgnify:FL=1
MCIIEQQLPEIHHLNLFERHVDDLCLVIDDLDHSIGSIYGHLTQFTAEFYRK